MLGMPRERVSQVSIIPTDDQILESEEIFPLKLKVRTCWLNHAFCFIWEFRSPRHTLLHVTIIPWAHVGYEMVDSYNQSHIQQAGME